MGDEIARRGLLQSLSVRPLPDAEGQESGRYEIPTGGRRFRALELLVKRGLIAKNTPISCAFAQREGAFTPRTIALLKMHARGAAPA